MNGTSPTPPPPPPSPVTPSVDPSAHLLPTVSITSLPTPSSLAVTFGVPLALPNALAVTVTPPPSTSATRTPSHVVLVIDVSGSMNSSATTKDATEDSGLSILDITKHAAKTTINLLQSSDKLTIVTFTDVASTLLEASAMTTTNRASALAVIEGLKPLRSTNLWDGLLKAMLAVKNNPSPNMLSSIMLLTDGVPNQEPPRGHIPMLKIFQDENPDLNFTVNTFGKTK